MSRDRRPEAGPMSDQRPEQTENDEQSTATSADEYGSLTAEDNRTEPSTRRPGRHGRGVRRRGGLPAGALRAGPQGLNRSSTCRRVWSPGVLH
jgi:hypothetical protein